MLSHASVMHNAMTMSFWLDGTPEMVGLAVLPLFHITGLVCVMHASIFAGGTLVIMPRWDRDLAGQLVSEHRVTHWTCIPTMIIDLLASPRLDQYDLSSLVYIGGGGAAMPQAVRSSCLIASNCSCREYGLTESAAVTCLIPVTPASMQVSLHQCRRAVIDME
jgi:fatty-acyl-CoA synthase